MARAQHRSEFQNAALAATLVGGLAAAILDIVYGFLAWAPYQVSPTMILQSIASGLLGKAAYVGGASIAALGLVLHVTIALLMALAYTLASISRPQLIQKPVRWGLVYGLCLYLIMNYVVLPLSAYPHPITLPPLPLLVGGIAIHAVGVGLPISHAARYFLKRADH